MMSGGYVCTYTYVYAYTYTVHIYCIQLQWCCSSDRSGTKSPWKNKNTHTHTPSFRYKLRAGWLSEWVSDWLTDLSCHSLIPLLCFIIEKTQCGAAILYQSPTTGCGGTIGKTKSHVLGAFFFFLPWPGFLFSRTSISLPLAKQLKRLNSLLEGGVVPERKESSPQHRGNFGRVVSVRRLPPHTQAGRRICYSAVATKQNRCAWLAALHPSKTIQKVHLPKCSIGQVQTRLRQKSATMLSNLPLANIEGVVAKRWAYQTLCSC